MSDRSIPIVPFRSPAEQSAAIDRVAHHLGRGGLIAYPTETVYGFGCLLRPEPLERLSTMKARTQEKPFLVLVTGPDMLPGLEWSASATALAHAFWPGPLTLALRAGNELPAAVLSDTGSVAVRATPHTGVRLLLERLGEPITSTSANRPGHAPALRADQAAHEMAMTAGDWPGLVLDGGTLPPSLPSTIVDCSADPPKLVRAGAIGTPALAEIINGIETIQS